jgi:hypothetical protein
MASRYATFPQTPPPLDTVDTTNPSGPERMMTPACAQDPTNQTSSALPHLLQSSTATLHIVAEAAAAFKVAIQSPALDPRGQQAG